MAINRRSSRSTRSKTQHTIRESPEPVTDLQDPLLEASTVSHNKRQRSATPDELKRIRYTKRKGTMRWPSCGGKGKTSTVEDEGKDPQLAPLKVRFSAVKLKYFGQILDNEFDPINISRLCNDVLISRAYQSKEHRLGKEH